MSGGAVRGTGPTWAPILPVLAASLPVLLFGWVALREPLTFDGGMNLQVAQHLFDHGEYARFYDELRLFPHEVQTNGPFIFLAAVVIGLLGESQIGLQLTNLLFVGGAAFVIWRLFRHWPPVATVAPALTLLLLPLVFSVGVGGQGELPALFFLLLGLSLLFDSAVVDEDRLALRMVSLALVAVGLGVTTKTMILGAALGVLGAMVAVARVRALPIRRVLVRLPWIAVPVLSFELFRLVQLGSPRAWWDWWSTATEDIAYQSGVDPRPGGGGLSSPLDRMHVLSQQIGLPAELIVLWVVAVSAAALGLLAYLLLRRRDSSLLTSVAIPTAVLTGVMLTYLAWWLLALPEKKVTQDVLSTRRIYPALLAGNLALLLLLCGCAALLWRHRHSASPTDRLSRRETRAVVPGVIILGLLAAAMVADRLPDRARTLSAVDDTELKQVQDAVEWIDDRPDDSRYYGEGWWSAPVVSLMAERGFRSTTTIEDWCALDPEKDLVVWDRAAQRIVGPGPTRLGGQATASLTADFGTVRFFALGPTEEGCPERALEEG